MRNILFGKVKKRDAKVCWTFARSVSRLFDVEGKLANLNKLLVRSRTLEIETTSPTRLRISKRRAKKQVSYPEFASFVREGSFPHRKHPVIYLKAALAILQQSLSGNLLIQNTLELGALVHLAGHKIPNIIPASERRLLFVKNRRTIQFWLSALSIFRVFPLKGKASLETIVNGSGLPDTFDRSQVPLALEHFFRGFNSVPHHGIWADLNRWGKDGLKRIGLPSPFVMEKSGPAGSDLINSGILPLVLALKAWVGDSPLDCPILSNREIYLFGPLLKSFVSYFKVVSDAWELMFPEGSPPKSRVGKFFPPGLVYPHRLPILTEWYDLLISANQPVVEAPNVVPPASDPLLDSVDPSHWDLLSEVFSNAKDSYAISYAIEKWCKTVGWTGSHNSIFQRVAWHTAEKARLAAPVLPPVEKPHILHPGDPRLHMYGPSVGLEPDIEGSMSSVSLREFSPGVFVPFFETKWKRIPNTLGKLALLPEAAGKVRVIAMVDAWTQWALAPLHNAIFKKLEKIDQDGTFDQTRALHKLRAWMKANRTAYLASYDLSAATDCLPIWLQEEILSFWLGPRAAQLWRDILVGRPYYLSKFMAAGYGLQSGNYYYGVGQPMGALSSWAMLALTHHVIVQLAAIRSGVTLAGEWFNGYALLGDDIQIGHKLVGDEYLRIMRELGVKIGLHKSIVSTIGFGEFAKKFSSRQRGIYKMVSIKQLIVSKLDGSVLSSLALEFELKASQVLALRGKRHVARGCEYRLYKNSPTWVLGCMLQRTRPVRWTLDTLCLWLTQISPVRTSKVNNLGRLREEVIRLVITWFNKLWDMRATNAISPAWLEREAFGGVIRAGMPRHPQDGFNIPRKGSPEGLDPLEDTHGWLNNPTVRLITKELIDPSIFDRAVVINAELHLLSKVLKRLSSPSWRSLTYRDLIKFVHVVLLSKKRVHATRSKAQWMIRTYDIMRNEDYITLLRLYRLLTGSRIEGKVVKPSMTESVMIQSWKKVKYPIITGILPVPSPGPEPEGDYPLDITGGGSIAHGDSGFDDDIVFSEDSMRRLEAWSELPDDAPLPDVPELRGRTVSTSNVGPVDLHTLETHVPNASTSGAKTPRYTHLWSPEEEAELHRFFAKGNLTIVLSDFSVEEIESLVDYYSNDLGSVPAPKGIGILNNEIKHESDLMG